DPSEAIETPHRLDAAGARVRCRRALSRGAGQRDPQAFPPRSRLAPPLSRGRGLALAGARPILAVGRSRGRVTAMQRRPLGSTGLSVTPLGYGLAAVGRPGYINLGRDEDLGTERSVDALERRAHELLDAS